METKANELQTHRQMSISYFRLAQTHMRAAQLLAAQSAPSREVIHFLDITLFNSIKSILLTKGIHIHPDSSYSEVLRNSLVVADIFPESFVTLCSTINSLRMQLEWDIDTPVPGHHLIADYLSETTRLMNRFEQYLTGH